MRQRRECANSLEAMHLECICSMMDTVEVTSQWVDNNNNKMIKRHGMFKNDIMHLGTYQVHNLGKKLQEIHFTQICTYGGERVKVHK